MTVYLGPDGTILTEPPTDSNMCVYPLPFDIVVHRSSIQGAAMTNKKHPLDKPMPCPVCGELVGPSHYTDGELRGDGTQAEYTPFWACCGNDGTFCQFWDIADLDPEEQP